MIIQDLSTLASQLRDAGLFTRNLGQVGITIWQGSEGFYISAQELRDLPLNFAPRDFRRLLDQRRSAGPKN